MLISTRFMRASFRWVIGLTVTLGVAYLLLATVGLAPRPYTCLTETRGKISGLLGYDFEISETDCSTLSKDASISVFASKAGRTNKVLLFKYDPAGVDELPMLASVDQRTIQISVPRISIVMFGRDNWEDVSVIYSIGVIDYPAGSLENQPGSPLSGDGGK